MKRDIELDLLRAFVTVSGSGQFVEAARLLGTSQSVISQRIKRLEDVIGAPIMKRGRHGIELTEVGEVLLGEAREILERSERGLARVMDCLNGRHGELRLGVAPWLLYGLAPRLLKLSRREAPDRRLVLDSCNSSQQEKAMRERRLDAGVLIYFHQPDCLEIVPLFSVPTVLVMSGENPLANKQRLVWKDLLGQPIVVPVYQSSRSFLAGIESRCGVANIAPRLVRQEVPVRSAVAHIAGGDGVGFVPNLPAIKAYGLEIRELEDAPMVDIAIACRKDDQRPTLRGLMALAEKSRCELEEASLNRRQSAKVEQVKRQPAMYDF
ncbi:MAG: hypothetical protein RLZ98_2164 [Pseudomonadota bacterium]|jgi:DNA-binding transcriptional LysR family regulator